MFTVVSFIYWRLTSLFDRLMTINKLSVHSPDSVAGVRWYLGWKCFTAEWLENKYDCIFRLFCGLSYNARNCLIGRYLVCCKIGTKLAFDGHKTKKLMFLAFSVRWRRANSPEVRFGIDLVTWQLSTRWHPNSPLTQYLVREFKKWRQQRQGNRHKSMISLVERGKIIMLYVRHAL